MEEDFLSQMGGVDVGVDLGGGYGFVTQHGLDSAEVGASFEQGGGEGVTKGVGRDGLLNACLGHQVFEHEEDHDASERFLATETDEDEVLELGGDGQLVAVGEVELQFVDGLLGDGHQTLLGAFAFHLDELVVEEEVAQLQVDQFADAQAAREEGFDDSLVAVTLGLAEVDDGFDGIDLIDGEHIGQMLRFFGKFEQFGRVHFEHIAEHQEMVETPHSRQNAREGGGMDAEVEHECGEVVEVFQLNSHEVLAFIGDEAQELVEVAHVGINRVGRTALLQFQILVVATHQFLLLVGFHRCKGSEK